MIEEFFEKEKRSLDKVHIDVDFLVAGGGMAGVCAAISAARMGLKTALVQDRPVLGGNASSEVRLWILGATSHMGNNNRWAREGGILNEILIENTYRNKEGNPIIFDTVLLDKVLAEENISLFLNTIIYDIEKKDEKNIDSVSAYNPQNETKYEFKARYYCDATGDGILAYLAGASFRSGAEDASEYDEKFAPNRKEYGEKLGHTIFFYNKDAGQSVKYVAPDFAMKRWEVEKHINRVHNPEYFSPTQTGCKYWWIEYGGRMDTVRETENVKYKLLEILYGIWDYIKNSGKYPEAENLTLEWVGAIPGKRESRRFIGYYMLTQKDVIEQKSHYDTVTHGGWSLDLHPADGVFSSQKNACNQWHSKGVYPIPYRCYITPDLDNVFLAGRIISASHVAFASTRVMATCGAGGEVVGTAAAFCLKNQCSPRELMEMEKMKAFQMVLNRNGVYIPQTCIESSDALLKEAEINVSSSLVLNEIPFNGGWKMLSYSVAQMLPLQKGNVPAMTVKLKASKKTMQRVELRISSKCFNHTPDVTLETKEIELSEGENNITLDFDVEIPHQCYAFVCFMKNNDVEVYSSTTLISGILSVVNKSLSAVSNFGKQEPLADIGVESFEFWCPERRPDSYNIAMKINHGLACFDVENMRTTTYRPVEKPNAWVADIYDDRPLITFKWKEQKEINGLILFADPDYDHPMESVQWGHYDDRMPYCVDNIEILLNGETIHLITDNHQAMISIMFDERIVTNKLQIRLTNSSCNTPVSLFGIQFK